MIENEIETQCEMNQTNICFCKVFYPWRRYLARVFDIFMYNVLWTAFLAFAFHVNLANRSNLENFFDSFVAIAIMLVLEPLILYYCLCIEVLAYFWIFCWFLLLQVFYFTCKSRNQHIATTAYRTVCTSGLR